LIFFSSAARILTQGFKTAVAVVTKDIVFQSFAHLPVLTCFCQAISLPAISGVCKMGFPGQSTFLKKRFKCECPSRSTFLWINFSQSENSLR
jgi:hypothetical protein